MFIMDALVGVCECAFKRVCGCVIYALKCVSVSTSVSDVCVAERQNVSKLVFQFKLS